MRDVVPLTARTLWGLVAVVVAVLSLMFTPLAITADPDLGADQHAEGDGECHSGCDGTEQVCCNDPIVG